MSDVQLPFKLRILSLMDESPEGILEVVLGRSGDPSVEVATIWAREAIQETHPPKCIAEATSYGSEVSAETLSGSVLFGMVTIRMSARARARASDGT